MNRLGRVFALAGVLGLGCVGPTLIAQPPNPGKEKPLPEVSPEKPKAPKEPPPDSLPAKAAATIPATWAELSNGMKIVSRSNRSIPTVQLRVAIQAGSSVDGEHTGLSALCTKAMAASGTGSLDDTQFKAKLEALGASLSVDVASDYAMVGLSVVSSRLGDALELVSQIITKPRLGDADVARVQKQLAEELEENARGDGRWGVMMMMHRDLFDLPTEHHPYASYDATAEDIRKIKPADCKEWHRKYFTGPNVLVAAGGDVDPQKLRTFAAKGFGSLPKKAAPSVSFTDPMTAGGQKITLVERKGGTQSEVAIGTLGPKKTDAVYAPFVVAGGVIGGIFSGRLWTDVREKQGLAYLTFSSLEGYANGPAVFYLYAQTQNESTGKALQALLDHAQKLASESPSAEEVERASRFYVGIHAIDRGHPRYAVEELVDSWVYRNSEDMSAELEKAVLKTTPDEARKAFAEFARSGHWTIVVSGDSSSIGSELQKFGEVKVVDPTQSFNRIRTLPFLNK